MSHANQQPNTPDECGYCGREGGPFHRDHVVPRSRGGPDRVNNIVLACDRCNLEKGEQLPSEWLGAQCPPHILLIEARINAALRSAGSSRDRIAKARATATIEAAETLADALNRNFTSPNVPDSNMEPANLVDVVAGQGLNLSRALKRAGEQISEAVNNLANAIREASETRQL